MLADDVAVDVARIDPEMSSEKVRKSCRVETSAGAEDAGGRYSEG